MILCDDELVKQTLGGPEDSHTDGVQDVSRGELQYYNSIIET